LERGVVMIKKGIMNFKLPRGQWRTRYISYLIPCMIVFTYTCLNAIQYI
jgi:hypothetical protein